MGDPEQLWDVVVVGGALAGLAAAARLAKNRHRVLVLEAGDRLGGRLAPYRIDGVEVDDWPGMINFPAPWRDLFRKSGRVFDDELARTGQALVGAPAARHVFDEAADGITELVLPSERGVQYAVLSQQYGAAVADRWRDLVDHLRDLVDHLDDVAQALRPLGGEAELTSLDQIKRVRTVLTPGRTVADLARAIRHPHLAAMINATAWRIGSRPDQTPGWVAAQLSDERRFGRWMITTEDRPDRTSVLLDRLVDRLATRRVRIDTGSVVDRIRRGSDGTCQLRVHSGDGSPTGDGGRTVRARTVVLGMEPSAALALLGRAAAPERRALARTEPALAAVVEHEILPGPGASEPTETVRHTPGGPVITWTRPLPDGRTVVGRHDWTRAHPDPAAGIAWRGWRTALRRPPIRSSVPGVQLAGPFSRGGAGLSHVVLSGALAPAAVHDLLRGDTPGAARLGGLFLARRGSPIDRRGRHRDRP